jgi:phage protein D
MSMPDFSNPMVQIVIDESPQRELEAQRIEVRDSILGPSSFSFDIPERSGKKWLDNELLTPGRKNVEISLGYVGNIDKIFVGKVNSLEYRLDIDDYSILTVQGFDLSTILQKSFKNDGCGFKKQKISDVVRQIASENGFECNCEPTEFLYESKKTDLDESDYSFIRRMAEMVRYDFYFRGKTLHFHPRNNRNPIKTLYWGRSGKSGIYSLFDMELRVSGAGAAKEIAVRGYDPKGDKALVSKRSPSYQSHIVPMGKMKVYDNAPENQQELDSFAQSLEDNAKQTMEIRARMQGDPSLRAGNAVGVAGISKKIDGLLFGIVEANHTMGPSGYETSVLMVGPAA